MATAVLEKSGTGRVRERDDAPAEAWREALRRRPIVPPRPDPWTSTRPQWRTMLQFRRNILPTWGPIAYEEGVLAGPFLGRQNFLLNDARAIRHVLVDNHENYGRTPATLRLLHPLIGDGLFLSEGATWRFQRRVTAPAFAPRSLGIVAEVTLRRTEHRLDELAQQRLTVVHLLGVVQRLTLEIAGEALFSQAMAPWAGELRQALGRYARHFGRPSPLDFVLPQGWTSPSELLRRWFGRSWHALIERIIEDRRKLGINDPPCDLFDALVTARDPETGEGFSPDVLRDQIATLIIAGHETTALSLFWSAYLLALAPELQDALADEAAVIDRDGANATLPLARAVVQEALRLYPPAFTIVRLALGPDEVGGKRVEPGDLLVVSPWVLHRHKRLWTDPDRFDPTRFLPGAPPVDRFAYLPFGIGPRVCVGAQFALIEASLVLALLARRFRFEVVGSTRLTPTGIVTLTPDRAVPFRLITR